MKKLLKILLWIAVSLVLVIVLAVILLPVLVDPNDYKDEITQQVYNKTGRTLTIEGDIDLGISLPLSVSLDLGKVELSNAEGFTGKPFARMQSASLFVSIWPLVQENRLDVGEIKLIGMELNLIKNKQGQTNWADLASSSEPTQSNAASGQTTAQTSDSKKTTEMPEINIAGLNISDAQINWFDEQTNEQFNLSKTNINISELVEGKPFKLKLSTHIDSNAPAIKGDFTLSSSPTVSLSQRLFKLPGTLLTLDLTGKMLPGGASKTTLGGDIILDGKAETLDIDKMKFTSYDMAINGVFHADKLNSAPQYNGQISIDKFSPKKLAAALGSALPEMKQAKALDIADAKMTFKGDKNKLNISSLEANLDDISLKGSFAMQNFQAPHYGFDLTLNQLNLDYYALADTVQAAPAPAASTADKSAKKAPAAKPKKSSSAAPIFPVEALRQLNLDGKLTIAQFIAGGAKMSNVVIVLKGKNGIVQLAPLKASLYQGSINLNSRIDVRGNTPKLKITNDLKNVQIGDLLQDTSGSQEFTGTANISSNITTSGNDKDRLVKNTNGSGELLITDGHIKKLDIITTLRKAQALYRGSAAPSSDQEKNTKFSELKGTFNIKNGVLHNNDLASSSPVMKVTGKGYADFPKEYLDYTLNIKLLNSLKIDDKSQGTDFKGKEIPYTIKGKFSQLSEEANISKVLEQEVKKKVEKEINKKLEEQLGEKFKGLLKF